MPPLELRNIPAMGKCIYYACPDNLTREHIAPRGMGGTVTQGSCTTCAEVTKDIPKPNDARHAYSTPLRAPRGSCRTPDVSRSREVHSGRSTAVLCRFGCSGTRSDKVMWRPSPQQSASSDPLGLRGRSDGGNLEILSRRLPEDYAASVYLLGGDRVATANHLPATIEE
jgi:hypothetical protein